MIKRVLIISAVVFIIGLVIFWFVSGGVAAAARTGKNLMNPIEWLFGGSASGTFIRLPWQPESLTQGPDISGYDQTGQTSDYSLSEQRAAIEMQYNPIGMPENDARTFGNPSPYVGRIMFTDKNTSESNPANEYVVLTANAGSPITMSGWSLQSAVSGIRMNIPHGAPLFILGALNRYDSLFEIRYCLSKCQNINIHQIYLCVRYRT